MKHPGMEHLNGGVLEGVDGEVVGLAEDDGLQLRAKRQRGEQKK
jgi:hypothetical protein